jgi:hypothetical protein
MSIVPKEVVVDAPAAWNAQADEFNQWDALGEDEKLEWTANRAAEWALEQAITTCEAVHSQLSDEHDINGAAAASWCAASIRAMISPEGKLKGGESDGQE